MHGPNGRRTSSIGAAYVDTLKVKGQSDEAEARRVPRGAA
jgi:hypothetical protein